MPRDAGLAALVFGAFGLMLLVMFIQESFKNPIYLICLVAAVVVLVIYKRASKRDKDKYFDDSANRDNPNGPNN